jgi:Cft2 family RNA processing exonuclease
VVELECLPYGVGHGDEGVAMLLRMGTHRILLDCGLADLSPFLAQANSQTDSPANLPADLVFCSHAHADHARGLLPLHRAHPKLPIYASELTTELLPLNWLDETVPRFCQALPWRRPLEVQPGLTVELIPAGHLPGAAALLLTYQGESRAYTALYTGDFQLSNSRLVDGFPLDELRGLKPDVLLLEGSYGTARLPHRRQQENQLAERIHRAILDRQSVLLPTQTLGLGQELLLLLRSHHHFTGRDLDIWVDGSVALGCDIYLNMLDHFPEAVQNFARHQALFWDERIRPRLRRFDPSLVIHPPAVVLTSQDADLSRYCQPATPWLLLLPQQPGRLGEVEQTVMQQLEASAPLQQMLQSGQLTLETYLLGDHCDGAGTTQMIHNLRPQHVLLTHGTPSYLSDLTSLEELQNRYHLHSPAAGIRVALPIGESFLQPAAPDPRPDPRYEAELADLETVVVVSLPESIRTHPRWQEFADTGLVEARWQGEELVLRSLSQRELLQATEEPEASEIPCCQNCIHCRGQRCRNPESPLFSLKVTLDGCCPMFEAVPD